MFLDWLRGLAAIIMLQGHVFHSFTRPDQREHGFYIYSQFLGGQAAAVFLFLTGITFGLGIARRHELSPLHRVFAALKRARYLFLLAILFRLQLFLTGWGHTQLKDLLQVDVLNVMGVTTALLSLIALLPDALARFRWAALAGIAIAGVAPLMSKLDTSIAPGFLLGYLVPGVQFSIFPWGSFIAFGLACGSLIPLVPRESSRHSWNRITQWAALLGFACILLGIYCAQLPFSIYDGAEFWLDSPALIACKLGTTLLMAAAAFLWTEYLNPGPSWVRLLGTTSLAVYWVHVELVYGNSLWFWKEQLDAWHSLAAVVGVVMLMTGMSWAIQRVSWREWWRGIVSSGRIAPVNSDAA
ncbi:MAG: acyltransferase family protein [Acidobacteriota bacterium]